MKVINIFIFSLIFSFVIQNNLFAQNNEQCNNEYAINAISRAVNQYHQQKSVGYKKYRVTCMKIMSINETSGEFVLNYIFYDFSHLNPTHYLHVNNELVLIIVDSLCKADLVNYGIAKITEAEKKEALAILPGPDLVITGSDAPLMVFKYDENNLEGKFYYRNEPPRPEKKYWF